MARLPKKPKDIESYAHVDKERTNNPPVGLVTPDTDPDSGPKTYTHDPHIDPQLSWAGKKEHTSFEVPTVSLHVHERVDPRTILEAVRKRNGAVAKQASLFDTKEENPPIREAIEFYKHRHNWTNRLIAGDSLLVMNSLLEKEGLGGKVQVVYIDPPYGIRYGSNFQPFVNKREVGDTDDDLTEEPEMIRAFRDTWELGIHSWLTYLRDRLLLTHELLHESGSVFVQIGDENLYRTGLILDEIFGAENRVATISFAKTSGSSASMLPEIADYLLWYAKDKTHAKYHQLYESLTRAEVIEAFSSNARVEIPGESSRIPTPEERLDPDANLPKGARIYRRYDLTSQGTSKTGRSEPYKWKGREFPCSPNRHWSVSMEGLNKLAELDRLDATSNQSSLSWKKYEEEYPGKHINNIWATQMPVRNKRYVVETAVKTIERCLLMVTDPGDLVLDPTCGSGTTAYVAEKWGRRWITCDTSRIAIALARQRLMTANFIYYELAHPDEGVGSGFKYESVPEVSPKTLSEGDNRAKVTLYEQPLPVTGKARVTGPFTVEAVPAPAVQPISDSATDETPPPPFG